MAYATTRQFIHWRLCELRVFFEQYYGKGYLKTVGDKCGLKPHSMADLLSEQWGKTNGRPGVHEQIRIFNASLLEALARDLGWRSGLSVKRIKSRRPSDNELTD